MPDPWEYPWFAAWDLGFHAVAWAHLDPAFAKYQLVVLLREWFLHPNGALPAYEWNFDDVNPPVHVMAALRVFQIDGGSDRGVPRAHLPEAARQLHVVAQPRRTPTGTTSSAAASSGSTTSARSTARTSPRASSLQQADGTAWMAYYALSMLIIAVELAEENDVYDDMVIKFLEQFVLIARALDSQGLYDPEDGFFYDRLALPSGQRAR